MKRHGWSILVVWACAIAAAIAIVATPFREQFWLWIPVAFASTVFITFATQLITRTPDGTLRRTVVSLVGSLAVFLIATAWLAITG